MGMFPKSRLFGNFSHSLQTDPLTRFAGSGSVWTLWGNLVTENPVFEELFPTNQEQLEHRASNRYAHQALVCRPGKRLKEPSRIMATA
jgi:hypothetical protein